MQVEEIIGKRVRRARQDAGLSQRELGTKIGETLGKSWTPQAVSQAENGARDWRARDLVALSWILRRPVSWFYEPLDEDQGKMLDGFAEGVLIHVEWTAGKHHDRPRTPYELAIDIQRAVEELYHSPAAKPPPGLRRPTRRRGKS